MKSSARVSKASLVCFTIAALSLWRADIAYGNGVSQIQTNMKFFHPMMDALVNPSAELALVPNSLVFVSEPMLMGLLSLVALVLSALGVALALIARVRGEERRVLAASGALSFTVFVMSVRFWDVSSSMRHTI